VIAEPSVCRHCGRSNEFVRGTCPNCGKVQHGEVSVFARDETRSIARGGLDDRLSMAVWFVPGLAVVLVGLVFVDSMALVILGVVVLIAPGVIWFLLEESDGSWW
jgi:Flp pilus assembly protein TadB